MTRNSKTNWGSVSRLFHWGIGFVIIGMIAYGWWMNHIPARAERFFHRSIHADIGYVVLLLMVLRLIWRWINRCPRCRPIRRDGSGSRRASATLYGATVLVAMLGWAHSGA
jgi:cytochrome b561